MIKRIDNIKIEITAPEHKLRQVAEKQLGKKIKYFKIIKRSLDARDKGHIFWLYSVAVSSEEEKEEQRAFEKIKCNPRVAVIGSGPAGLCCAIRLVEHGFCPVVIERGEKVEDRKKSIQQFFTKKILKTNSNVQFGEGGAGTFSDGKLNTQTKDGLNRDVLEIFHRFGASEEILFSNKPHIGSDVLYTVLQNIRSYIEENGGKFLFQTQVVDFTVKETKIESLILKNHATGAVEQMSFDSVVLAIGHSARDTFEMLHKKGIAMEAKDFALGVRIEHLAAKIGQAQYGKFYELLPTADYKLVSHAHERTVFTFCMCPGGVVIPAASEEGGVVTNGMSYFARDGKNSNSALMVQMKREDFGANDLFAGVRFQREIEQRAYRMAGENYSAPIQRFEDFKNCRPSKQFGEVQPTYSAGTSFCDLNEVLPKVTADALRVAIPDMARRLKGFDHPDCLLTGVETRFSSPVKILRDATCESVSIQELYPCGEGSGYSGGITSSAADGLKVAEILFEKYNNH